MKMESVMEYLVNSRADALSPEALGEIFDRLIWCLKDNGKQVLAVRENWLRSVDRERVKIALAMNETYPFKTFAEMKEVLMSVGERWPELRSRCDELIH